MKKGLISIFLLSFILVACPNSPTPVVDGIEYCQAAETNLKELGCIPKDKPYTVKGKSFKQFCEETMSAGINIYPECISKITECDQVNTCVQTGK